MDTIFPEQALRQEAIRRRLLGESRSMIAQRSFSGWRRTLAGFMENG